MRRTGGVGMTGRAKGIVAAVVALLVLTLVLVVVPALSPSRSRDTGAPSAPEASTDADIRLAKELIASGETTRALSVLTAVKARDASADVDALIESIKPAESAGPDPEDGTADEPPSGYTEPVDDIASLLPSQVPDFTRGVVSSGGGSAVLPFDPDTDTQAEATVRRATFEVRDGATPNGAKRFLADTVKRAYPADGGPVRVGTLDGYFGTDSTTEAAVAFARGRYVFLVVASVQGGAPPKGLQEFMLGLAGAFPAAAR